MNFSYFKKAIFFVLKLLILVVFSFFFAIFFAGSVGVWLANQNGVPFGEKDLGVGLLVVLIFFASFAFIFIVLLIIFLLRRGKISNNF